MIGIDKQIEKAKVQILKKIPSLTGYGRAYLNLRDEIGVIPEVLTEGTKQYKEVLMNTSIDGLCFFVVESDYTVTGNTYNTVNVGLYFAVNLVKLYPTITERAIEYLHRDVQNALKHGKFNVTNITMGREAFSGFADSFVKIGDNMQPYYLCKFTTTIEYNINEC